MSDTETKPRFEVRGINHLALVVADMAKTRHFYTEVLGLPMVRARELADGGQQAFFAITDNTIISAVWYPEAPEGEVGVIYREFSGVDEVTGQHKSAVPGTKQSAAGSMHHLAFTVPLEKQEEYKERLREAGVPCTEINHHIAYGNGKQAYHPTVLPNDAEAIDEFVNSLYFPDPDGRTFEFAAYTRPLVRDDVTHTPARAGD
ncbi:MAG: VOC family protein [Dehalococcoidia bacterium]|nr:VOC family protein [Thermoflexaceae bacterium]